MASKTPQLKILPLVCFFRSQSVTVVPNMGISSASLDNDHRMIATAFMLRIGGAVAGQSQAVRILTLPRCGPSPGTTPGMLIMGSHRRSLASSSSGSNGSEPRLSRRNKVDLLALAMGICGGVGYYYLS